MSNIYGFDFLQSEHQLTEEQGDNDDALTTMYNEIPQAPPLSSSIALESDLGKQHKVIDFLRTYRSGCLQPGIIYEKTGVDLSDGGRDEAVRKMLCNNKVIKIEEIPDPENPSLTILIFGYQAKYNDVRNKTGLLAQINKSKYGIRRLDLLDSYEGVKEDIHDLITAGDIIGIPNAEEKENYILCPRGEPFFVELDGHVSTIPLVPPTATLPATTTSAIQPATSTTGANNNTNITNSTTTTEESQKYDPNYVKIDVKPKKQIRRGEAIWIGGQWFRISSAIKEGSLSDQPSRAQAPLSVTSKQDLSQRNAVDGYYRDFTDNKIPLDHKLSIEAVNNTREGKAAGMKLHKIASSTGGRGITGGASAHLLSSNATSDNHETLVEKFAFTTGSGSTSGGARRRPTASRINHFQPGRREAATAQIEEASKAAKNRSLIYCHPRRHGCTLDIRDLYLATKDELPPPEREKEIFDMMVKYKLIDRHEKMKRPRLSKENMNLDNDGRPKKRRYYERKGQRMTNTHLNDTPLGILLREAADKQQQGKSVGDGGM